MPSVQTSAQPLQPLGMPAQAKETAKALPSDRQQETFSMRSSLSFGAGCMSGALARLATNSPRDIASKLQNSKLGLVDLPGLAGRCANVKNLTSCTIGTAAQYAVLYGLQSALQSPEDSNPTKLAKDGVSAIVGGLAIHPSTVAFYHKDSNPAASGRQNLYRIATQAPQDLLRGLRPRVLTSSSQWVTFFGMKDALKSQGFSEETSRGAASLGGVVVSTPSYQVYAYQCRNGGSTRDAFAQVAKLMTMKPSTTALFAIAAASEMYLGDMLQTQFRGVLEKAYNSK